VLGSATSQVRDDCCGRKPARGGTCAGHLQHELRIAKPTRQRAFLVAPAHSARPSSVLASSELAGSNVCRLWKARIPSADEACFACLLASSEAAARAHEAGPLEQRVEDLLMQWLRTNPGVEQVAERLGLSVRMLHRQLSARSDTLRALIERTRRRELDLLQQTAQLHAESAGGPALAAGKRAGMLGFSNAGALRNALRRWAGRL
jgi:AraC-like DNA-binding protein